MQQTDHIYSLLCNWQCQLSLLRDTCVACLDKSEALLALSVRSALLYTATRYFAWYFASSATKSTALNFASNAVSCNVLAHSLILESIFLVTDSRFSSFSSGSGLSQKKHIFAFFDTLHSTLRRVSFLHTTSVSSLLPLPESKLRFSALFSSVLSSIKLRITRLMPFCGMSS